MNKTMKAFAIYLVAILVCAGLGYVLEFLPKAELIDLTIKAVVVWGLFLFATLVIGQVSRSRQSSEKTPPKKPK